jgi:hypothetical protein
MNVTPIQPDSFDLFCQQQQTLLQAINVQEDDLVNEFVLIDCDDESFEAWKRGEQRSGQLKVMQKVLQIWRSCIDGVLGELYFAIEKNTQELFFRLSKQALSLAMSYHLIQVRREERKVIAMDVDALQLEQRNKANFLIQVLFSRCMLSYKKHDVNATLEATLLSHVIERFLPDLNPRELPQIKLLSHEIIDLTKKGLLNPIQAQCKLLADLNRRIQGLLCTCLPPSYGRVWQYHLVVKASLQEGESGEAVERFSGLSLHDKEPAMEELMCVLFYEKTQILHATDVSLLSQITFFRNSIHSSPCPAFDQAFLKQLQQKGSLCGIETALGNFYERFVNPLHTSPVYEPQGKWWMERLAEPAYQEKINTFVDQLHETIQVMEKALARWRSKVILQCRKQRGMESEQVRALLQDASVSLADFGNLEEGRAFVSKAFAAKLLLIYACDPKLVE